VGSPRRAVRAFSAAIECSASATATASRSRLLATISSTPFASNTVQVAIEASIRPTSTAWTTPSACRNIDVTDNSGGSIVALVAGAAVVGGASVTGGAAIAGAAAVVD